MKRDEYVFAIGFDGNHAIVDKRSRSRYRQLSIQELAEKGLFQVAYRSAVFDQDRRGSELVLEKFNSISPVKYDEIEDLSRVFGVQPPSDSIIGVRVI